jgi:molybdate transport system substrate-binding protein
MRSNHRLALGVMLLLASWRAHAAEITVFAAASLTDALPALAARYAAQAGVTPGFSFAASSLLARQIEAGAVADVFIAADEAWMDYLAARGLVRGESRRPLAGNRLVLIGGNAGTPLAPDARPDVAALLGTGRLAIGDPAHVPAGQYARAALTTLGQWAAVKDRLVPAESVRAALTYVAQGETPLGIVYATDARAADRVRVLWTFPADSHPPIRYPAAVTAEARAPAAAAAFVTWLAGPDATALWRRFGFEPLPGS